MFYLGGILLTLAAALFACWPLMRRRNRVEDGSESEESEIEHNQVVRDVYRQRIAELERETIDQNLREEIATELGAVLLSEVVEETKRSAVTPTRRNLPVWLIALLIPIVGAVLYIAVGEPSLQQLQGAQEVLSLSSEDEAKLKEWSRRLENRTQVAPDDSASWYLLGHSYLKLGQFGEAAQAFATTSKYAPEDLNVQVYWLQTRYLAAGGKVDGTTRNLAETILEKQPNIPVVLEILALDAFQNGAHQEAVTLLNRALTGAADIRQQAAFAAAIRQVRSAMEDAPGGVTVNVNTQQAPAPQATVFVLARPVGGGMPYAVARRPAFLLPFSVTLDDLVSMSPGRLLSAAEEFEVVVRVSTTGSAMPQDGDWQWVSEPLAIVADEMANLDALLTP